MSDFATKTIVTRFDIGEVKEEADDKTGGSFSGLASTWDLDLGGDVIRPGAFKRTLKNWKSAKRNPPFVDSHALYGTVMSIVGELPRAEETDTGLDIDVDMLADDDRATGVFKRIKRKLVDGLSIGYNAVKVSYPTTDDERRKGIYRYLDEVKLNEVSVVMFPMNPNARIDLATAKSLLLAAKDRDLQDEEITELAALHQQIGDLLQKQDRSRTTPDDVEEVLTDPDKAADLVGRIDRIFASGLATRIAAAQHSGRAVLTSL